MYKIFFAFIWLTFTTNTYSQIRPAKTIVNDSLYSDNIKKSRLYGVYIPRDIDDAIGKLMELTTPEARKPLTGITEQEMAKKLYFGLGRWMEYNWNFEEGSRFSHYLRQKGLTYTEDKTRFMLIVFHRHLMNKPPDVDNLVKTLANERKKLNKIKEDKLEVISEEHRSVQKND